VDGVRDPVGREALQEVPQGVTGSILGRCTEQALPELYDALQRDIQVNEGKAIGILAEPQPELALEAKLVEAYHSGPR